MLLEVVTSGAGEQAQFREPTEPWSLRASRTGARRLTWLHAQTGLQVTQSFLVTLEGDASKHGLALDDIAFTAGNCKGERCWPQVSAANYLDIGAYVIRQTVCCTVLLPGEI